MAITRSCSPRRWLMLKTILAGATALAIAGGSLAYAQKAPDGPKGAERWRPTAQDMAAFGDARIAALKAGLKLTPDQEKNWPAGETAMRDMAKERADRRKARMERMVSMREQRRAGNGQQPVPDLVARLRARA